MAGLLTKERTGIFHKGEGKNGVNESIERFIEGRLHKYGNGHVITECPLCNKPYHLYINVETGLWDCKRCGEKGNIKKLYEVAGLHYQQPDYTQKAMDYHRVLINAPQIKEFLTNRGLNGSINKFKFGYSDEYKRITIPYWNRGKVTQIRYRAILPEQEPKYLSSKGTETAIFNIDDLRNPALTNCLICEGEFDTAVAKDHRPNWAVVGIPGANSFKPEWARYFARFNRVIVAFDNDQSGRAGAIKIKQYIPHAEIIEWKDVPEKFDITDYYTVEKELPELEQMIASEAAPLIPKGGFIKDYLEYCKPLTDAPDLFHLFTSLSILSTAVQRKRFIISYGGQPLYPNTWIVLLAPSSFYRKTTAINIAKDVVKRHEALHIYPNEFSRELIQEHLSERPKGIFVWSEFGAILSMFNRDYMSGTKDFFAELYDCPASYTRKLKGKESAIKEPYINVLAATNIDWFKSQTKASDVRGGFINRFLYIPVDKRERFIAIPAEPDEKKRADLLSFVNSIIQDKTIKMTNEHLKEDFSIYQGKAENSIIGTKYEILLSPFWSRLEAYLWKFAMLYMVSVKDDSPYISHEAFYWAVDVIEWLKNKLRMTLIGEIADEGDPKLSKVLESIKKKPGVTTREIVQYTHLLKSNVISYLDTLVFAGDVSAVKENNTVRYYPNNRGVA